MARQGHIKIARKAYEEDRFWLEPREFSRWEAWEYMIQAASFKKTKWSDGTDVVDLCRGETRPLSLRHLAGEWRWTVKRVRVFLELCASDERIEQRQQTDQGHTYYLVNYELYQGFTRKRGGRKGTAGAQQRAQPGAQESPVTATENDGEGHSKGHSQGHNSEAVVVESKDSPTTNWVGSVVDLWREKAGEPNGGRVGKALKPIQERYEMDVILRVLAFYLDNEDAGFATPERFAQNFVKWGKQAKEARDGTARKGRDGNRNGPRSWDYGDSTAEFKGFNESAPVDSGEVPERDAA